MAILKKQTLTRSKTIRTRVARNSELRRTFQERRAKGRERKVIRAQFRREYENVRGRGSKFHQHVHEHRAATAMQEGRIIPSSWIFSLFQDEQGYVYVRMGSQNYKSNTPIPGPLFREWADGKATCKTNDTGIVKRFWIGKTPTLGGFYNKKIKGHYRFGRI